MRCEFQDRFVLFSSFSFFADQLCAGDYDAVISNFFIFLVSSTFIVDQLCAGDCDGLFMYFYIIKIKTILIFA